MKTDIEVTVTFDLAEDEQFDRIGYTEPVVRVSRVVAKFDPASDWEDVDAKGLKVTKKGQVALRSAMHYANIGQDESAEWLAKAREEWRRTSPGHLGFRS